MTITPEGILIVVGWLISVGLAILFAVRVIPARAAKMAMQSFGLAQVMTKNGPIYVPQDLDGEPVKIPIGSKEENGEQVPVFGYAPLPMTLTYLAATQAAQLTKMAIYNLRSQVSKKMEKEALSEIMKDGGSIDQLAPLLGKKAQTAVILARALGITPNGGQGQTRSDGSARSGGRLG